MLILLPSGLSLALVLMLLIFKRHSCSEIARLVFWDA
jgi:hypothetical protein